MQQVFKYILIAFLLPVLYGTKVYRIHPINGLQVRYLRSWIENTELEINVWMEPSMPNNPVDIQVKDEFQNRFINFLDKNNFLYSIMVDDLEKLLQQENIESKSFGYSGKFDYYKYNQYSNIRFELSNLERKYKNAKVFHVGNSFENQTINGLKITNGDAISKPAVWIDGGIHAREWISTATVMFFINRLLTDSGPDVQLALSKYDFYLLPVFNPDGYRYTFGGSQQRLWRNTLSVNPFASCKGADPNRNFAYKWGEKGASNEPCKESYRGLSAFSEIEVKNVAGFLEKLAKSVTLKSYWNLHAYSQLFLTPWSYTTTDASDQDEFVRISKIFTDVVSRRYGTKYRAGSPANILYPASGGSIDWTYGYLGVIYSFALELRDNGSYGFVLPADQIKPTGEETTDAILAAINAMK
ncbi:carboxypeptidase B-like [Hydra vulgaris]|uniref:Carboxypeptidase B-like n=1 Tax=Hydra vulgaris TaxID=6087 RepID=A0ABM4BW46_HYDVU